MTNGAVMQVYTQSHEWLRQEKTDVVVGITDYGQQALGEIVFAELPAVGASIKRGQVLCVVESVKVASEILSPISGTVARVNRDLVKEPRLINMSAEQAGWLCVLAVSGELRPDDEDLLTHSQYLALIT